MAHILNDKEVEDFHRDGCVIVKNFFSKPEIESCITLLFQVMYTNH